MELYTESRQHRCLILFRFIRSQRHKFVYSWLYKSSPRSLSNDLPLCKEPRLSTRSRLRDQTEEGTEMLTEMPPNCDPHQHSKLFAESQRWLCDVFLYRPVIESGLSASLSRWYFSLLSVAWRRWREGVSQRCDGGIMEFFTGQHRTIDLSAGSRCPPLIRHNIHTHQQSIRPGFLGAGSWMAASTGCCPVFADSVRLSFNENCEAWPPVLALINQCRQMSSTQKRWCHIKLLASKLASLTIFFLSAISLLIVPSVLFRISFAFYNTEIERNPELKVIWISPYRLNCFSPSCWFLSTNDESYFFPPVRHILPNFNAIRGWLFSQTHSFSVSICCWKNDNVYKLDCQYWLDWQHFWECKVIHFTYDNIYPKLDQIKSFGQAV